VAAWRSVLPADLQVSRRLTDGGNVDHNRVFQAATLTGRISHRTQAWLSDTAPEGDATLKAFKRAGGHVWLRPENPAYNPTPDDRAVIVGKAVHISRTVR
jgi:Peptidase S24-like